VLLAQPYGFLSWSVEDGLPQSQVTSLAEDNFGYLWVGTQGGGVARFDGKEFRIYTTADGLLSNFVEHLSFDDLTGALYAETQSGMAQLRKGAERWEESDGAPIGNPTQSWWPRLTAGLPQASAGLQIRTDRYLVGTTSNGLYLLDGDGAVLAHYTELNSDLPRDNIRALMTDRQGRYWIATSGGGIARMIPTGLRHFDQGDGLLGDRVYALHQAGDRLWIGASQRGMQYRDSSGFHRPIVEDPTRGVKITSITQDWRGRTYFGTDGRGITVLDSQRVDRLTTRSGLPGDWILKLFPGNVADETYAVTYANGIARIENRDSNFVISAYGGSKRLLMHRLTAAIDGRYGSFLLGTKTGEVLEYGGPGGSDSTDLIRTYGPSNGLPEGPVKALALRRGTQLWVGITGHGLYFTDLRADIPIFAPLPTRLQRDLSTNIFQLTAPEDRPEIWVGTERGVTRLFLNRDGQPDWLRHYGRPEGFLGGETTGASVVDKGGNIWFGTMNGLVRYEDDDPNRFLDPPATHLEAVNLFYTPVDSAEYVVEDGLPHFRARDNHFNFRFRAVDLTYPDRIRYRYRLRGEDTDWSPLTEENAVRYAGLSPSRYTFAAQATTDGGRTWGEVTEYTFVIAAPLVKKPWFLGVVALLGATLLVGGFYGFYRRLQRQEATKRRALEARNQLLELEQKALQLQMNPHFIFNALNGIRGLVDGEHDLEARQQISRFAGLMRGILNNSRRDAIPLSDELKTLEDYLKMEQFCQPFSFTYTLHPPPGQDAEEISLPPMLLQPFVENAILHGLSGRADGGHVDVHFSVRGRRMQCTVTDNGIGRKAAAERRPQHAAGHKSHALDVTKARLQALKGKLRISDGPTGGTVVEVTVPVETW